MTAFLFRVLLFLLSAQHVLAVDFSLAVQDGGFLENGVRLESALPLSSTTRCTPLEIAGSWAVASHCLRSRPFLHFDPKQGDARLIRMDLEIWIDPSQPDREFSVHYASGGNMVAQWLSVFNTHAIPRGQWTTMPLYFSYFQLTDSRITPIMHPDAWGVVPEGYQARDRAPAIYFGPGLYSSKRHVWAVQTMDRYRGTLRHFSEERAKLYEALPEKRLTYQTFLFDLPGVYIRKLSLEFPSKVEQSNSEEVLTRWIQSESASFLNHKTLLQVVLVLIGALLCWLILSSPFRLLSQLWMIVIPILLCFYFAFPTLLLELGDSMDFSFKQSLFRQLNVTYDKMVELHKRAVIEKQADLGHELQAIQPLLDLKMKKYPEAGSLSWLKETKQIFETDDMPAIQKRLLEIHEFLVWGLKQSTPKGKSYWNDRIKKYEEYIAVQSQLNAPFPEYYKNKARRLAFARSAHPICHNLWRLSHDFASSTYLISPSASYESNRFGVQAETTLREDYKVISKLFLDDMNIKNESLRKQKFSDLRDLMHEFGSSFLDMQIGLEEPLRPIKVLDSLESQSTSDFYWTWLDSKDEVCFVGVELNHFLIRHHLQKLIKDELGEVLRKNHLNYLFKGREYHPDLPLLNSNQEPLVRLGSIAHQKREDQLECLEYGGRKKLISSRLFRPLCYTYLSLELELDELFTNHKHKKNLLFLGLMLGGLLCYFLIWQLASSLIRPLSDVDRGMNELVQGEFGISVPDYSLSELHQLSTDLKHLIRELRETEDLTGFLAGAAVSNIKDLRPTRSEEVCIIFCGVFGIEKLEEDMRMEELGRFLNEVQVILDENHAMVDKFTGAACLAVFQDENRLNEPVRAAEAILKWKQEGGCKLDISIGLATGKAMFGHVGSQSRKDYTCIGDTVNLAARLECLPKLAGQAMNRVYLDRTTFENHMNSGWEFEVLEPIAIKGKSKKQEVYALRTT